MLHLDTLVLHNFKSFKHASIKFANGFNCIIGANGSGKSSICDSLLFALGENSLKRLHVPSFSYLINTSAKPRPEDGVKRAYVKLTLTGDAEYEIMRVIKSNNKISYRLNGKHVTKQEILDLLHHHHCEINETNVIAQGEIEKKLDLNAKERRELIDVAAGIKEFDEKKEASLKELEKVEEKINEAKVMLNERIGFLEELKKEKEDAERYMELTSLLKRANFTLLSRKEEALSKEYSSIAKNLAEKNSKIESLENSIKELDMEIEKISSQKQSLLDALSTHSSEASASSRILEEINKNIAVLEAEINSAASRIEDLKAKEESINSERKKILDSIEESKKALEEVRKQLAEKEPQIPDLEPEQDLAETVSKYEANQKVIYELVSQKEALSSEKAMCESKISELKEEISKADEAIADSSKALDETEKRKKQAVASAEEKSRLIEFASGELAKLKKNEAELREKIDDYYRQSVEIKEKLAMMGSGGSNIAFLRGIDGFYGSAEELCTYEEKHAVAIQAAASSRLSYLVVDNIDVAAKAIEVLKAKGLGRATFIPLKDLVVAKEQKLIKGAIPLISLVNFDKKFENAFYYIFSNTYLVESIGHAKAIGIGKARFVTPGGEVIESSGVVSGGIIKESRVQLNARLRSIENEKASLEKGINEIKAGIEAKAKEIASMQVEQMGMKVRIEELESSAKKISNELYERQSNKGMLEEKLKNEEEALENIAVKLAEAEEKISSLKNENESLYRIISGLHSKTAKSGPSKVRALREEVEGLKIKMATKEKESEMLQNRLNAISEELSSIEKEKEKLKNGAEGSSGKLEELKRSAKELEAKIKSMDEKSSSTYKQISGLDAKLASLSQERGRLSGELERAKRDVYNLESSKVQIETKLGDIKAELLTFGSMQQLDKSSEELEKQSVLWKAEIEKLGAVNLKAPEIYEEKNRDVNEAREKVATLESEKESILGMISEIEAKKVNVFMETFNEVNENFKKLYSNVFPDYGYLELENPKDPFNFGLLIKIRGSNNKEKITIAPSGGEKSLYMLMLIFAIQMCKPMSFYIFDEIDVALDKENTKKLSLIIKELSKNSQMIIVSHNDNLIISADAAIGVAKNNGESKAFGIEISELRAKEQVEGSA
ncbi:MAG: AAA family ATPase [Candidatus Micrarchaeia archaeon]